MEVVIDDVHRRPSLETSNSKHRLHQMQSEEEEDRSVLEAKPLNLPIAIVTLLFEARTIVVLVEEEGVDHCPHEMRAVTAKTVGHRGEALEEVVAVKEEEEEDPPAASEEVSTVGGSDRVIALKHPVGVIAEAASEVETRHQCAAIWMVVVVITNRLRSHCASVLASSRLALALVKLPVLSTRIRTRIRMQQTKASAMMTEEEEDAVDKRVDEQQGDKVPCMEAMH